MNMLSHKIPTGINLCEVGPTECHANATCLDRDGGYDCECNDGYTGNGTHCEGQLLSQENYCVCSYVTNVYRCR